MKNSFPILIAEDNPVSKTLLEKSLIKAGYEVVSANDAQEAFKILKKTSFRWS